MVTYSIREADLAEICTSEKCVLCFTSNRNCPFDKTVRPQNGLLIFFGKTHSEKIMEIVEDFVEESHINNGNPWKSSRILCGNHQRFRISAWSRYWLTSTPVVPWTVTVSVLHGVRTSCFRAHDS